MKCRMIMAVLWGMALALPVSADVYKCPDAAGKVRFSNVPCNAQSEAVLTTPTPSVLPERPAPVVEGPAQVAPPIPSAPVASAPPPPVASRPPSSNPIDTNRFGALNMGMSEATVRAKVGDPDEVIDEGSQIVGRGYGRVNLREVPRYAWVYYGDGQILDTHLHFAGGQLVAKEKVAR